ncbi:MAG: fdtA [Anaerocolumna sp.]|jgi:dTDP-4-dehydrorhamnose 3,5-epimerase-like enzyme|nr:fdtA [Anaerocolumna sp.]
MKSFETYNFNKIGNLEIGYLTALEEKKDGVPFQIKRVYYIYNVPNQVNRGFHAHKELKQILICLSGSVEIRVEKGDITENFKLNDPTKGLFINALVWREMYNFSNDAVLLVLASDIYKEDDYIRDYQEFLKFNKR